jgi:hypothetical protein
MTEISDADAALLRRIAEPEVNGVPGACAGEVLDGLLTAGLVRVGYVPAEHLTEDCAWVKISHEGWEWLHDHPASAQ